MMQEDFKSAKSKSVFTVAGERSRAYLTVSGEAATDAKVQKEVLRIRREGGDFDSVKFVAKQLSRTH